MTKKNEWKVFIHDQLMGLLKAKIRLVEEELTSIHQSKMNETKSSAGDKYETGRSMLHQEEEKWQVQLRKSQEMLNSLHLINPLEVHESARFGSLVQTEKAAFFISIPFGKVICEGKEFYAISPVSPMGNVLQNKSVGNVFEVNGKESTITGLL